MSKINKTDPICGMKGNIYAHGHYFCSEHCIKKYEKENKIKKEYCPECEIKGTPFYKDKLFWIFSIASILLIVSYFIKPLNPYFTSFVSYLKIVWWAILLGLIIGGIIDYFVPREYISKILAGSKKRNILYAVLLGFLMSACSHGILAITIQLYKKGASVPAVVAFLLASPWANLPVTILLFSFFGLKALVVIVSALVIATITGFVYQFFDRKGWIEKNKHTAIVDKSFSIMLDIKKRMKNAKLTAASFGNAIKGVVGGAWALSRMVVWWIIIGMVIASAVGAFMPKDMFMTYLGPTLLGLLITLAIATIIEVCSEGSAPLAFEIFRQTGAMGNSFVFLMAGVVTDYTEIGLLWSNIGKRTALLLPVVTVPMVLLLGFIFNAII